MGYQLLQKVLLTRIRSQQRSSQRLPPSPNTACTGDYETLRRGEFDDGGGPRSVLIAVDARRRLAYAIDEATCTIVLAAPIR